MTNRRIGDRLFAGATRIALGLCFATLAFLLGAIIFKGVQAMSPQFLLMPEPDARDNGSDTRSAICRWNGAVSRRI